MSPKAVEILMDYLNWDKYLITQWIAKTINEDNRKAVTSYLDGAMSRIEWLIVTLWSLKKAPKLKSEEETVTDAEAIIRNKLK